MQLDETGNPVLQATANRASLNSQMARTPKIAESQSSSPTVIGDMGIPKLSISPELEKAKEIKQAQTPKDMYTPEVSTASTSNAPSTNGERAVTQAFGNPNPGLYGPGGWNRGVDLAYKPGEPQHAPPEGEWVVVEANSSGSYNTGWGNSVVIQNRQTGEKIRRSHFDKVLVKPGEIVTGKALGTTGRTGRTTGYHADVEYINPQGQLANYLNSPYGKYY